MVNNQFMDFNDLSSLRYFVAVYQLQSLTAAAKKLGVSKAAVAKRVALLEQKLGLTLFVRSTRKIQATPEARSLYEQSQNLLAHVKEFEEGVLNRSATAGALKITAPPLIVQNFLGPVMARFHEQNPETDIELVSSDNYLDISENSIDLALRMGKIPLNNLVGKKLGENRVVLCASPKYLKKNPEIRNVMDLKKHSLIYIPVHGDVSFEKQDMALKDLSQPKLKTNDPTLVTKWGLEGEGVIARSVWSIRSEIQKGQLIPILKSAPLNPAGDVWLVSSPGRLKIPRVRKAFDLIWAESRVFFAPL
jgi:DNA-binding transcriptional LysR family regulator